MRELYAKNCCGAGRAESVCFLRGVNLMARFFQKHSRLSSPPKRVVKMVESASRMSPARSPLGGIQRKQLNSLFPASMKGCGLREIDGLRGEETNAFCCRLVVSA